MGDLVLTADELEPVMMKLQEGGIQESALHNHLLGESPHVMYMHIASHGDAVQMAKAIHEALALAKTPAPDVSRQRKLRPNSDSTKSRWREFWGTPGRSTVESFRSECQGRRQSRTLG